MKKSGFAHPGYAVLGTDRLFELMAGVTNEAATQAHPRPLTTRGGTVCRLVFPCYDSFYDPFSRYKGVLRLGPRFLDLGSVVCSEKSLLSRYGGVGSRYLVWLMWGIWWARREETFGLTPGRGQETRAQRRAPPCSQLEPLVFCFFERRGIESGMANPTAS